MDAPGGLALLEQASGRVTFEGIALGPGVYVDAARRRIRVRDDHLGLAAERMRGVFLRDLHREDIGASVGVVASARVEGGEVRFTGDVRLAPYVDLIRAFGPHIRFSLGFRYDPAHLVANPDGTHDLPADFLVDHLALVPQGQYPNARLVRLLNQARGLTTTLEPEERRNGTMGTDKEEQLRQQRDDALRAAEKGKGELEQTRADLGKASMELAKARADLEAAGKLAEAVRLELGQAKTRVAQEVMKLELKADRDFDLDARRQELTGMDLGALDQLRCTLRLEAEQAGGAVLPDDPEPPSSRPDRKARPTAPAKVEQPLDLSKLGLTDTLRLAFHEEAF